LRSNRAGRVTVELNANDFGSCLRRASGRLAAFFQEVFMNVSRSTMRIRYAMAALLACSPGLALDHDHGSRDRKGQAAALVKVIREATARFQDVEAAKAENYQLHFGCVSADDVGAMGLHYVNMDLVMDPALDPKRPEIVIYEPQPNGTLKLIGADFLVLADAWNAAHGSPPELMGQLFHLFESPNRFGLPAFYTLHVWAWKENPKGAFVNWHPHVSCDAFSGEGH
jgi:hypothetical protein